MANDQIQERKASYRKAVGAKTTESQTKAAHFHNDSITSSDDPVVEFSSDDGLNSFGSGKKRLESGKFKFILIIYHSQLYWRIRLNR